LQQIHAYLFGGLYDFADKSDKKYFKRWLSVCRITLFRRHIKANRSNAETTFDEIVNKYVEINIAHPFMEGNGRSTRIWLDLILKKRLKKCVDGVK